MLRTTIADSANNVDAAEVALDEPPHLYLHCLPSSFFLLLNMIFMYLGQKSFKVSKCKLNVFLYGKIRTMVPGRVAQSVGHLTRKSGVLGSIPSLATYFCFFFLFFKKGSRQLLAKVCARSTG